MKVDVSVEVSHPREKVFEVYRDRLPELLPYLPNVRSISVKERREEGNKLHFINRWQGGGELPAVARSFVSDKLLEWDDYATWDNAAFTCDWRTVADAFKDALKSEGKNHFDELPGGRTRFRVDGIIEVDAKKIPKVPRLVAGAVGPAMETFLVATLKPNLVAIAKGVERYLNEKK